MKKILSIVGARPQFVKAAMLSRAFQEAGITEEIVHTGQHFDAGMSEVFFEQMRIPRPKYNLGIGGLTHGAMTGRTIEAIEKILLENKVDAVLVFGDTNATLSGALAAVKLHIPVAHVEAGMRSYNRRMPEEINRVVTDHLAQFHFVTHERIRENLNKEGIVDGIHVVGDLMADAVSYFKNSASKEILEKLKLQTSPFILVTIHRQDNVDDPKTLETIMKALTRVSEKVRVVFPVHPRTMKMIQSKLPMNFPDKLLLIEPVGYLEMICLTQAARAVVTDSGGLQQEAYFLQTPCITVRTETEWVETIELGWNRLTTPEALAENIEKLLTQPKPTTSSSVYGDGNAGKKIAEILLKS